MKLRFGGFVLDQEAGCLTGPEGEVRLRPQAFRMLEVLAEQAPKILSQEELLDRVWGVEHLSPASVKQAVSEVRQALGDDPARPEVIETVHRRGYRFIAPVERIEEEAPPVRNPELATRPIVIPPIPQLPPPPVATAAPAPRRLRLRFAAVPILAGLSALALVQRPLPEAQDPPVAQAGTRTSSAGPTRQTLAVLGFKNLSGDPADEWISSALTEIVGFELAAPGRLRLIPADSVARMKRELSLPYAESHSPGRLAGVGRNLGTDLVVTGSYLLAEGEKLRVQLLVQDVRTGETVAWARETGDPEELIELATAAARGVQGTLGGDAGGGGPEAAFAANFSANKESLRLYSQAMTRLRLGDAPAALPLLDRTVALDGRNPFAHDALAAAYARLGFDGRAAEAAQQALALSAGLPREIRLGIEGRSREVRGEWEPAVQIYSALWRLHPDDLEAGLRLAAAQTAAGHADLSLATLDALRKLPPPAGNDPRIDLAEHDAAWQLGDFARSRDAAQRAVAGAGRRAATVLTAEGHLALGWAFHKLGQEDAALAEHRKARGLFVKTGDRAAAASALVASAVVLQATGRPAEARRAYEEAIPTFHEIGDRSREAKALNNYAALLNDEGDLKGVTTLLERSLAIKREIGDLPGVATTLANLGNQLRGRGELRQAQARLEEALALQKRLKNDPGTAFALRGLARVLVRQDRTAEALSSLEEALALTRKTGDAEGAAETLLALGDLTRKAGRLDRAREHYQQAFEEFQRLKQTANMVYPLLNLGGVDEEQRRFGAAFARFNQALVLARKADNDFLTAYAHTGLASAARELGDLSRARSENEKALALWTKLGDEEQAAKTREELAEMGKGRAS